MGIVVAASSTNMLLQLIVASMMMLVIKAAAVCDIQGEASGYALITKRTSTYVNGYPKQEQIGEISFNYDSANCCMRIKGVIKDLTPGLHGFHIHEYGDLSNGCVSTGSHYNPYGVVHAGPGDAAQHVGDLGNIVADDDGIARVDVCVGFVRTCGQFSVLGRAVVVHAKADDLGRGGDAGSLATGNAGGRVGCGVI